MPYTGGYSTCHRYRPAAGAVAPAKRRLPLGEDPGHGRRRVRFALHLEQRAHDIANHVMQVRVGRDLQPQKIAVAPHLDPLDAPDGGFRLALHRTERGEIVLADQRLCRGMHGRGIERTMDPRRPRALQRRARAAVQDAVTVDAANGPVPRMKADAHLARPLQGNRRREPGVRAQHPGAWGAHGVGIEMNDLAGRVHAAVGAAGADDDDGLAGYEGDRGLDGILDRRRVLLRLPAGVFGAVILDDGCDAATRSGGRHEGRRVPS